MPGDLEPRRTFFHPSPWPATALAIGEMVIDDLALILRGLPPVRLQAARRETVSRMRSPPAQSYTTKKG